ncbi:MAG: hypothetical protein P1V51_24490 [Deltaproteobacteria bacterium]|nr:hypothetical protein [Deltaproteobacteria bacterium]
MYRYAILIILTCLSLVPHPGWASTFRAAISSHTAAIVPGVNVAASTQAPPLGLGSRASPGELGNLAVTPTTVGDFLAPAPLLASSIVPMIGAETTADIGDAISTALSSTGGGQAVWLQVLLASLPVLGTILVLALKLIGVFEKDKVRQTIFASVDHGYGYVEELKRIHGGDGLDKTAEFIKAFRAAMIAQGVGEPTQAQQTFALAHVKKLHVADKKREAELEVLASNAAKIPMFTLEPVAVEGGATSVPPSEPSATS